MSIISPQEAEFTVEVDVAVLGSGDGRLCAGTAAQQAGAQTLILERDSTALGTTAMSTGIIPAAGTSFQNQVGIDDSPENFTADICKQSGYRSDQDLVLEMANESATTIE